MPIATVTVSAPIVSRQRTLETHVFSIDKKVNVMSEQYCKRCGEKLVLRDGISWTCKKCKCAYMYVHYANNIELVEFDEMSKRLLNNLELLEELSKEFLPIMEAPLSGFGSDKTSCERLSRVKHSYKELYECIYTTSELLKMTQAHIAIENDICESTKII